MIFIAYFYHIETTILNWKKKKMQFFILFANKKPLKACISIIASLFLLYFTSTLQLVNYFCFICKILHF